MTLGRLISLAYYAAEMYEDATAEECADIQDFARVWYDLQGYELEDIRLSEADLREWDPTDTWR